MAYYFRRSRTGLIVLTLMLFVPLIHTYASADASNDVGKAFTIPSTIETISLGRKGFDNGSPSSIAINERTNLVYVSNRNSDNVSVINATTNKLVDSIMVGFSPGDLAVSSKINLVYVTKPNLGVVIVIDGSTNKVMRTIELSNSTSKNYNINGIAVNEKTNKVYVLTHNFYPEDRRADYASISVIDGVKNEIEQSFKVADLRFEYDVTDDPRGIAINSKTNTIYVVLIFGDVYVIDGTTNTVTGKITIGYEKMPHQANVNEETNMVYVSNFGNQSMSVVDGATNKIVKTISVGYDPQGIAIDPATNTIYLVMYGGQVAVFDGSSHSLVDKIAVQEFPERAAFNRNNGYLYVTNAGSNTVSLIGTNQVTDDGNDGWKTARVFIASEGFSNATIRYKLSSGAIETPYIDMNGQRQVQRNVIVADIYFPSLTIPINSSSPGTLVIELPRRIIDSKMNDNVTDSTFSPVIRTYPGPILKPAAFMELNKTDTTRVLAVQYPARLSNEMSDQVDIIISGQLSIPEFGTSVAITVMALSIGVTALILSRRYMLGDREE
jgi:YVTN family beta-propeller protein